MKAIILCGGVGTRLGALTQHTPKPLVEVAGRPFLGYVLDKLSIPAVEGFILATGYLSDQIERAIGGTWKERPVQYSAEALPLGTGGAVRLAMETYATDTALVANGDTLFDCDLEALMDSFAASPWATRMALREVPDCARYGRVHTGPNGTVQAFGEKGHVGPGLINAGLYMQRRAALTSFGIAPFSFETDYLASLSPLWPVQGLRGEGYFIDIGIPEDLERARRDLAQAGP